MVSQQKPTKEEILNAVKHQKQIIQTRFDDLASTVNTTLKMYDMLLEDTNPKKKDEETSKKQDNKKKD